jgi:hypothetical protein
MSNINKPNEIKDTEIQANNQNSDDKLDSGLKVISFCIPLVGIIIYFSNKNSLPNKANSACTSAKWGIGIGFILRFLSKILEQY